VLGRKMQKRIFSIGSRRRLFKGSLFRRASTVSRKGPPNGLNGVPCLHECYQSGCN
jgi:hypothetical protein